MPHILLIEDDLPLRNAYAAGLRKAGHSVDAAGNGLCMTRALAAHVPDVVITDIVMADSDGLEVIMAVQEEWADVPVIAISGSSLFLDYANTMAAEKCLLKPFTVGQLVDAVLEVTSGGSSGSPVP